MDPIHTFNTQVNEPIGTEKFHLPKKGSENITPGEAGCLQVNNDLTESPESWWGAAWRTVGIWEDST